MREMRENFWKKFRRVVAFLLALVIALTSLPNNMSPVFAGGNPNAFWFYRQYDGIVKDTSTFEVKGFNDGEENDTEKHVLINSNGAGEFNLAGENNKDNYILKLTTNEHYFAEDANDTGVAFIGNKVVSSDNENKRDYICTFKRNDIKGKNFKINLAKVDSTLTVTENGNTDNKLGNVVVRLNAADGEIVEKNEAGSYDTKAYNQYYVSCTNNYPAYVEQAVTGLDTAGFASYNANVTVNYNKKQLVAITPNVKNQDATAIIANTTIVDAQGNVPEKITGTTATDFVAVYGLADAKKEYYLLENGKEYAIVETAASGYDFVKESIVDGFGFGNTQSNITSITKQFSAFSGGLTEVTPVIPEAKPVITVPKMDSAIEKTSLLEEGKEVASSTDGAAITYTANRYANYVLQLSVKDGSDIKSEDLTEFGFKYNKNTGKYEKAFVVTENCNVLVPKTSVKPYIHIAKDKSIGAVKYYVGEQNGKISENELITVKGEKIQVSRYETYTVRYYVGDDYEITEKDKSDLENKLPTDRNGSEENKITVVVDGNRKYVDYTIHKISDDHTDPSIVFSHKDLIYEFTENGSTLTHGTVYIVQNGKETIVENGTKAGIEYNSSVRFVVRPAEDYYIANVDKKDDMYELIIEDESAQSNRKIDIIFEKYEEDRVTSIENSNLAITNTKVKPYLFTCKDGGEDKLVYVINKYDEAKISDTKGVKFIYNEALVEALGFQEAYDIKKTVEIKSMLEKYSFRKQVFDPKVIILVDKEKPEITVDDKDETVWISGNTKEYKITGSVEDKNGKDITAGIKRVVAYTHDIENDSTDVSERLLTATDGIEATYDEDKGTYTLALSKEDKTLCDETTTYYIYAVDHAGNYTVADKEICVDTVKPTVEAPIVDCGAVYVNKETSVAITGSNTANVTVYYYDTVDGKEPNGKTVTGSGVKKLVLYRDGEEIESVELNVSQEKAKRIGSYTFSGIDLISGNDNAFTVTAEDNVGNEIPAKDAVAAKYPKVIVDTTNASIKITSGDALEYEYQLSKDSKTVRKFYFYKDLKQGFPIRITQSNSGKEACGIKEVSVVINEQHKYKDSKGKSYALNQGDENTDLSYYLKFEKAGTYDVTITATSRNGKKAVLYSTFVVDDKAPSAISKIQMSSGNLNEFKKLSKDVDNNYTFFAGDKITCNYVVEDEISGVKQVDYYSYDADSKEIIKKTTVGVDTKPNLKNAKGEILEDGCTYTNVEVEIPKNTKGYFYTSAKDNLGNESVTYSTPGFISEDKKKHAETSHIKFILEDTDAKDTDGNPLFNKDTKVAVDLGDSWSGLSKIEWIIEAPGENAVSKKVDIDIKGNLSGAVEEGKWKVKSGTRDDNKGRDHNLVVGMLGSIDIKANSNKIKLTVTITDNCGNVSKKSVYLSVDKKAPVMTLSFDNNKSGERNTFNASRVATVTIVERNFDEDAAKFAITSAFGKHAAFSAWTHVVNYSNPDASMHTINVIFDQEDDYTFSASCTDMAGNPSNVVSTDAFSVDKTAPVISVIMDGRASSGNFYNGVRTATIRVVDRYFNERNIVVSGKGENGANALSFPTLSAWTSNGDEHVATLTFSEDGTYSFAVEGTDMAGNKANTTNVTEFIIDRTMPELSIKGVANNSANKGSVVPVITFSDNNFDKDNASFTLTKSGNRKVEVAASQIMSEHGVTYTLPDFEYTKDVDDIYTLTARIVDKAGNEKSETVTFSINRFGSNYVFDETLTSYANKFVKKPFDIVLTETNVDAIDAGSVKIILTVNGTPKELKAGEDFTITSKGGEGSWYQNIYTISKKLFKSDGAYTVSLYSKDAAGNVNENTDESKKAEITFGVDGTAPVIVPINLEDDGVYDAYEYEAMFDVSDNLFVKKVTVTVAGKELAEDQVQWDVETGKVNFKIKENDERQEVVVTVSDAAGNTVSTTVKNILVTTNDLVRITNEIPMGAAAGGAGGIILLAGVFVFATKRRKDAKVKGKYKVDAK